MIVRDSYTLLVSNRLRRLGTAKLASANNGSMWRVGTVLGTPLARPTARWYANR